MMCKSVSTKKKWGACSHWVRGIHFHNMHHKVHCKVNKPVKKTDKNIQLTKQI